MSLAQTLARTAPLYDRVKSVIPPIEWPVFADDIDAILALKRRRNAVILAHNYQTPEIFHCVADIVGDSLALAREAMKVDADGDRAGRRAFHGGDREAAEPGQDRADPGYRAPAARWRNRSPPPMCGCCAQRYPGVPVVTYVNTSAAVKAESDICCTSGNAAQDRRIARRGPRDHAARRIPGAEHRRADRREDHHLGGPLRGARALHRRADSRGSAPTIPASSCWRIPNARRRWWPRRISPAPPPICRLMSASTSPRAWC